MKKEDGASLGSQQAGSSAETVAHTTGDYGDVRAAFDDVYEAAVEGYPQAERDKRDAAAEDALDCLVLKTRVRAVRQTIDSLTQGGWLTPGDAAQIRATIGDQVGCGTVPNERSESSASLPSAAHKSSSHSASSSPSSPTVKQARWKIMQHCDWPSVDSVKLETLLDALIVAVRSDQRVGEPDEAAWLIEGDANDLGPGSLRGGTCYWAGGPVTYESFTGNHLEAVRFSRKADAEQVIARLLAVFADAKNTTFLRSPLVAVEHLWLRSAAVRSDQQEPKR